MTQTQHKLRAVILAALMVLSVFAIAFAGTAVADNREVSGDDLTSGDVIFQGETLTEAQITATQATNVEDFSTDNGEVPLTLEGGEIPQDQQTGVYTAGSDTLTVRSPSISDLEINNGNGEDVAGGSLLIDDKMNISVTFNYAVAENMTVSIENEAGVDVTSQFLNNTTADASVLHNSPHDVVNVDETGTAVFTVFDSREVGPDLAEAGTGTYTITAEGAGSLDFGDATQSTTITIVEEDDEAISLDETEVTKGEDVTFTVTGHRVMPQMRPMPRRSSATSGTLLHATITMIPPLMEQSITLRT
jgi:surface glycoprotein (TIGR04207 family)